MIQYFPIVTGSLTVLGNINVSGSITTSGSITISGSITSASFASTASFVALAQSASNAVSAVTASYANNLTVAGTLTAQTIVVQTITSSVDFVTGSTRFGSILGNTHVFSGSVTMNPGGLFVSSSGNVGIGTTTPIAPLHIYSSNQNIASTLATSYTNAKFRLEPFNTSGVGISMGMITPNINYLQGVYADGSTTAPFVIQPYGNNVGIGTSSPASKLYVRTTAGATKAYDDLSKTNIMCFDDTSMVEGVGGSITFGGYKTSTSAGGNFAAIDGIKENGTAGNEAGAFRIWTANGSGVFGERMRVTSGGNIGINDSSPTSNNNNTSSPVLSLKSTTAGAYPSFVTKYINGAEGGMTLAGDLYIDIGGNSTSTNNNIIFRTTNTNSNYSTTERLRISSAGNLNFNTAGSGAAYMQINQATGQDGGILWLRNNSSKYQQALDNSDNMVFYSYAISNNAYKINSNGSATLYGALTQNASDRRLKNNITNIPNALDKIKTLNGVTFNWENNIFKTERTNDIGVIAQEVQSVLPEAVALAPFDIDSEGNSKSGENYLTVYYEKLIPLLIESIKELNTKFEEYKATHP
jgi:hypothetical protein